MMTKQNCIDFSTKQNYSSHAPQTWGAWLAAGKLLIVREVRAAKAMVALWVARHQGRRELANLDSHQLADIGLTKDQAMAEAYKAFWQA